MAYENVLAVCEIGKNAGNTELLGRIVPYFFENGFIVSEP
jgi:hypothetical protein